MKIGVCIGNKPELIEKVKNAGFDYAELNCGQIAAATKEELDALKAVGLPLLCANCFIGLRVVGDERDDEAIKEYIERLMSKCAYLGVECTVFGSSGARRIPQGGSYEKNVEEVVSFLRDIVAPVAEKYNITVAIEPLRKAECNFINTVEEGVKIAKLVNRPSIKVLGDCLHMYAENEPFEKMVEYSSFMYHAHASNPCPVNSEHARVFPAPGDKFNQDLFMLPVIKSSITHCSVEASCKDFHEDLKKAYEIMKKYR